MWASGQVVPAPPGEDFHGAGVALTLAAGQCLGDEGTVSSVLSSSGRLWAIVRK